MGNILGVYWPIVAMVEFFLNTHIINTHTYETYLSLLLFS
jgi:hypothetical protein